MNDDNKKNIINSFRRNDLDNTSTFNDILSRTERRNYDEARLKVNNNLSKKENKKSNKTKKGVLSVITGIILFITLLICIGFTGYNLINSKDQVNQLYPIINSSIIVLIVIFFIITVTTKKDRGKKLMTILTSILFIGFVSFNVLTNENVIKLPTQKMMLDFTNKNINEAITWANANNIKVDQIYETSDNIKEYYIISQSVTTNTLLKDIKEVKFYVSSGPNYEKEVIISDMVGWNIDDAIKIIKDNFLNNVEIEYVNNNEIERDIIISQNIKGQIKRNSKLNLTVSLGNKDALEPIAMINLKNKTLFDATLWLKRNGIKYKVEYDFSDTINKNNVMGQSELTGTMINQKEKTITIIISKGKKIIVPDLNAMTINDITNWIIKNKLKVEFKDKYDNKIEKGKLISSNYKQGDEVSEGTTISLTISNGQLKFPKIKTLAEFREWANKYEVKKREEFEFSDAIKKGEIIKLSHQEGDVVNSTDTVVIFISNGKAVTIPDFYGKTQSSITSTCNSIGLNCTFYTVSSSRTKGTAVSQNKTSGAKVVVGTYVNIGISSGTTTPTTPACDKSKTTTIWLDGTVIGTSFADTKARFTAQYPKVKFNFVATKTDYGSNGQLTKESAAAYDGKTVNYCDTYTINIISK